MNGDKFDYFAIFDEFPISILILDLKGIIKYCNQSVVTLLNLTFDEIIGFHFSKLPIFPNGNKDVATSLFQKVIKEGVLKPQEFKLKGKNGLIKWIIIVAAKIRVNENFFIQLIARDISKEKIIKRRLQESEQKFRKIAEQALMGIAIIQDDEIKYINKHFADLIRYDIKEINNWEPGFYKNIIHSEDRDVTIKRSKKKQGGDTIVRNYYQIRLLTKEGELVWIDTFSKTINFEGKPANLITIIDITKQKRAEKIIQEENKRLKQLDDMRQNFLDNAAHELKSPLTSVYGATQLLKNLYDNKKIRKEEDVKELIEIIENGSEKLKNLILNLLDLSRLESEGIDLQRKLRDIIELIKKCIKDMRYQIKRKNHKIVLDTPNQLKMKIDPDMFKRVICNLLDNAIKFTKPDGIITIKVKKQDNLINISISDNGIGIKKVDLKNLFKKFISLDKPLNITDIGMAGTGLGLNISKQIVELHKGKIWAESKGLNKGTTFYITLPFYVSESF